MEYNICTSIKQKNTRHKLVLKIKADVEGNIIVHQVHKTKIKIHVKSILTFILEPSSSFLINNKIDFNTEFDYH